MAGCRPRNISLAALSGYAQLAVDRRPRRHLTATNELRTTTAAKGIVESFIKLRRRSIYAGAVYTAIDFAPPGRPRMVAGSAARLGYGLAALLAPRLVAGSFAAAEPDSAMNLRGFGGQHIALAVFTLISAQSRHLARPALVLNVGVEICDAMAGALEVRERGTQDELAVGGVVLPLANLRIWLTALSNLSR
jgi:hypothetical protein